ncbi:hypothetical protein JW824_14915 [bacterium]|nr:hypothetical protein [bacterium]
MEFIPFSRIIIINLGILWLFLLGFYLLMTNTQRLKKRGYQKSYQKFLKKDIKKRTFGIAWMVPLIEIVAALIVKLIFGDNLEDKHIVYWFLFIVLLITPFPILDMKKTNKKYKELAKQTQSDVVIDFNYKIYHLIFSPVIELFLGLYYTVYFILTFGGMHPGIIHTFIPWLFYGSVRMSKNQILPALRDYYVYSFVFLLLNYLLASFHLIREFVNYHNAHQLSNLASISGILLIGLLFGRIIFYLIHLPRFKKSLKIESFADAK